MHGKFKIIIIIKKSNSISSGLSLKKGKYILSVQSLCFNCECTQKKVLFLLIKWYNIFKSLLVQLPELSLTNVERGFLELFKIKVILIQQNSFQQKFFLHSLSKQLGMHKLTIKITVQRASIWRTAARFIDQKQRTRNDYFNYNKEVPLMQMSVKSTHWLLIKRETIPTTCLKIWCGTHTTFSYLTLQ